MVADRHDRPVCSIAVLGIFWRGHWLWSRRYGLEDSASILISWAMIVTILIFIYPLKAIFGAIIQTSPGFTPRIFVLHPVEHQRAVECGLVAQGHIGVLIGDFQQPLANRPTLGFTQIRKLLDDFGCAHGEIIASVGNLSARAQPKLFRMRRDFDVTPVLIFPGWTLKSAKAETGVVLLNDDMISNFFESRPTVLPDDQITNICSHLDQTARS